MVTEQEHEQKIWVGKDGLINIRMTKGVTEKDVDVLFREIPRLLDELGSESKIIIDLTDSSLIYSPEFRKKSAARLKDLFKQKKFRKIAMFGGNTMIRTTASFILLASGVSNVKIFETKAKALEWLKKP